MQNFPNSAVNGLARSTEYPRYPTQGGRLVVGTPVGETFFQLSCGMGGTLIVLGRNDNFIYYPVVAAGEIVRVVGKGVVAAATIDGMGVTTTADNIWWYGGM